MFGIGPTELLLIGLLLLVLFGPGKAAGMARDFGRFVSGAQNTVEEFKEELLSEEVREARRTIGEFRSELTAPVQDSTDGVRYSVAQPESETAVPEEGDELTLEPSPDEEDGKHMPKDRRNPLGKEEVPPSEVHSPLE
jgi:Sec-independent protein translocase protein TatA